MTDLGIDADEYWSRVVPEALFDAAASLPDSERYDAIIVDEGQDFRGTYWEAVQMLLKDPDGGILYIFYDDSQRLYSEDSFPLPEPAGRLNRNLRSTYEIGKKVADYYQGVGTIYPTGPQSGREIEVVDLAKYGSPQDALADVLSMLADEKVGPGDIVLLTPLSEGKSIWKHKTPVGDFELVRSGKIRGGRVLTSTIHSFKGLERPVVILSELGHESSEENLQLLYVALSRARHHVIVLGQLPAAYKKLD
jgi:superfamily I DNA and RNA helicase